MPPNCLYSVTYSVFSFQSALAVKKAFRVAPLALFKLKSSGLMALRDEVLLGGRGEGYDGEIKVEVAFDNDMQDSDNKKSRKWRQPRSREGR